MTKLTKEQEKQLLSECINNNNWDELVKQYGKLIYYTVRKIIKCPPFNNMDIEDVCQEVFLKIFRKIRLYRDGEGHSLKSWIRRIAIYTALNYIRKKGFDSPSGQNYRKELNENYMSPGDFGSDIINRFSIETALKNLSANDRLLFKLRFIDGLSSKETAHVMNISVGYVNNRILNIKKKLKELIETEDKKMLIIDKRTNK